MSADSIDSFPWFLNKPLNLQVNDLEVMTRISSTQWSDHWRPFLTRLRQLWLAAQPHRFIVAIAGPPGSGKSVFAEQLNWITGHGIVHKDLHTIALPMDGFHYPQTYLDTHTRKNADGSEIPLASVKGQYDTIDAPALRERLKSLSTRSENFSWPGYSRFKHDVVPNKFHIHPNVSLVFVEGNYLLLDKGPFAGIPALFDLRIFLDIPPAKIMGNLMARHIAGGKDVEEAKAWVKKNDLLNARLVESTRSRADVLVQRDLESEGLSKITWIDHSTSQPSPTAAPVA